MSLRFESPDEVSPDDLTNIIIYSMRVKSFGIIAANKLNPFYLDRIEEQYVKMVWIIMSNYITLYSECPPISVFKSELSRLLGLVEYAGLVNDDVWLSGLNDYVDYIYDSSHDLPKEKYIKTMLSAFLKLRVKDTKFEELKTIGLSYEKLMQEMKDIERATSLPESNTINPFDIQTGQDEAPYGLDTAALTPYGLHILDTMFGGYALGECLGLLGLTGGGKTLLQIQIACAAAQTGTPVLYCSYEQGFKGDIAERVYSYVGEFDRSRIHGLQYKDFPEDIKTKIKTMKVNLSKTLIFADMVDGDTGVNGLPDIKMMIEKHADLGYKPKIVIIDWLVPFLGRSGYISGNKESDLRKAWASVYGNLVKDFAIENNIHLILSHQLNTDVLKKPITYKPTLANAYDLGISFGQYMQVCLSIGQLSHDKLAWLNPCKARSSAAVAQIVKMNGAFSRFESASKYTVRNGKFVSDAPMGAVLDIKGIPLRSTAANNFEGTQTVEVDDDYFEGEET